MRLGLDGTASGGNVRRQHGALPCPPDLLCCLLPGMPHECCTIQPF